MRGLMTPMDRLEPGSQNRVMDPGAESCQLWQIVDRGLQAARAVSVLDESKVNTRTCQEESQVPELVVS